MRGGESVYCKIRETEHHIRQFTFTTTTSMEAIGPPSGVKLCIVEIEGPFVNPSLASHDNKCDEFPLSTSFTLLYASRISWGSFRSELSLDSISRLGQRNLIFLTLAPATPIFLPIRMLPLSTALAMGASILALSRYHPSVISSSGNVEPVPSSGLKMFDIHRFIGRAAGAS